LSKHSKKWDEDEAKSEKATDPHYQKYGERSCKCPVCPHDFVYKCASI